jgi:hypothetical protein
MDVLNNTGINNTANGNGALTRNTTGSFNTANGYLSLSSLTTGSQNTAIGYNAQVPIQTGSNQIAIGTSSETVYIPGPIGKFTTSSNALTLNGQLRINSGGLTINGQINYGVNTSTIVTNLSTVNILTGSITIPSLSSANNGNQYVFINSSSSDITITLNSPNVFARNGITSGSTIATISANGDFSTYYFNNTFCAISTNGTTFT